MTLLAIAARTILSVVFLLAGFSKLGDLKGSRQAITDFGLPLWSAGSLGVGIPVAEVLIAALLLLSAHVWSGALGALILSSVFSAAIAINLGLGRRPSCHCFGQMLSKPVGRDTLGRSVLLAALAAFVVWHSSESREENLNAALATIGPAQLIASVASLFVLGSIGALFWFVLELSRQNGRLLVRIEALEARRSAGTQPASSHIAFHGLPIGTEAIPFELPTINAGRASLHDFLQRARPVLLISTDPNCGPCNALMPEIARWQKSLAEEITIVLLSHGSQRDNQNKSSEYGLTNVLIEPNHKVANKYSADATPTGVLIRSDGKVGSPAMGGADAIRRFITHKAWTDAGYAAFLTSASGVGPRAAATLPIQVLPIGSEAPAFALPDLAGGIVSTASFNGVGTALVFWNPACGFCQRMLPRLKEWEINAPSEAPRLVLVSAGTPASNQAMELKSTVLIDERFAVGQMYGSRGTPSGLLVDAKGRVASPLAVGEPELMKLLSVNEMMAIGA